jgi:HAE1 family hydrophobic/amphiphilic exporter-1
MGKDHFKAAHDGTDEIGLAVAATTFSIVAVFIPIAFLQGEAGQWFKPMALTIACAVLVSLFVSFSLDPMLSAYWADPQLEQGMRRGPIARLLTRFNDWFERQAENYKRVIAWALDHRLAMVVIAIASMIGALTLQVLFGGFGFVPNSDRGEIYIGVETPPGSNLDYTRLKAEEVARLVRSRDEVDYTYVTVGSSGSVFGGSAVDQANIYVRLIARGDRELNQDQFAVQVREQIRTIGGAQAWVFSSGFGGADKEMQIELRGPDARRLAEIGEQVAASMAEVPGVVDIGLSTRGQKPELNVRIDRGVAGSLGVTVGQIAQALRPAFAGIDAGDWIDPEGETRDVMVRLSPEARRRPEDIRQLPLVLPSSPGQPARIIPLEQVARIEAGLGPAQIDHLDREKVVIVGANVQGTSLGVAANNVEAHLASLQLPPGYSWQPGGFVEDQNEFFAQIFAALGFALLLMYLILVVQFGSFVDPIAIMMSLPLSLIGVVLMLLATNTTLNVMSLIGVMLLMGIVAKNAILLIDFAKWGRERGLARREALIEAGRIRLRPILMTSFALIAGMTPVALGFGEGADFRAPLGRAVIGGVVTSTFLTLLVIPTVYEILDEWKESIMLKVLGRKPTLGHAAGGGLAHEAGA